MHKSFCGLRRTCFILSFLSVALIVAILLRHSHRISSEATRAVQIYSDPHADPELLFAGFNNETGVDDTIVPNIVHFVLFGIAGQVDFTTFLCILAAIKVHQPSTVYLHSDSPFYFGKNNSNNRYWLALKNASQELNVSLQVRHLPRPSHVFGQRLSSVWHAADVARINVLQQYGGIALDRDQLVLKPLHKYRHFEMALGWPEQEFLGTQILIAHPKARLLRPWLDSYRHYRPSMWYYNAAQLPTQMLLVSRPELVHRERWKFGVQNLAQKLYTASSWQEWHQLYSVHLLSRHHYLLKNKEHVPLPENIKELNEFSIQNYEAPYGDMARHILHELTPQLPAPTLWPGQ